MARTLPVAQAKAGFSECLRRAESGETVVITRQGKAVAALVPATVLEALKRLEAAAPEAGLAALAGGWKGSHQLVKAVLPTRRSPPRRSPAR